MPSRAGLRPSSGVIAACSDTSVKLVLSWDVNMALYEAGRQCFHECLSIRVVCRCPNMHVVHILVHDEKQACKPQLTLGMNYG